MSFRLVDYKLKVCIQCWGIKCADCGYHIFHKGQEPICAQGNETGVEDTCDECTTMLELFAFQKRLQQGPPCILSNTHQ